jgi:hypothetical protein
MQTEVSLHTGGRKFIYGRKNIFIREEISLDTEENFAA